MLVAGRDVLALSLALYSKHVCHRIPRTCWEKFCNKLRIRHIYLLKFTVNILNAEGANSGVFDKLMVSTVTLLWKDIMLHSLVTNV